MNARLYVSGTDIAFLITAGLLVFSSAAVVILKNPVRATFLLILSFLPTTAIYFFLHAPFVGILQILVYAGAILILFTFVVMMVNPSPGDGDTDGRKIDRSKIVGLLVVLLLGGVLLPVFFTTSIGAVDVRRDFGGLKSIGQMLFADPLNNPYILSFELLSFLVLAGIVAAVSLARIRNPEKKKLN
ncbi:MAG: NADH-quinone oxidoreductase subunit J [Spirochaetia bacterium]|nr:NADH-quinone oxidoreductase subunit J [Spirochaetia bacterium]